MNDGTALASVPYLAVEGNVDSDGFNPGGVGLQIDGVEFGMVLVSNGATSYSAIKAKVTTASLGIAGLGITVTDFFLAVNKTNGVTVGARCSTSTRAAATPDPPSRWPRAPRPRRSALTLKATGALLKVSGHIVLDVFGFVSLDGEFAFKKASGNFPC
ncbi:MAG: hypothetical protein U1G05_05420 [Kiritimatiellia bacterium]